MSNREKSEQDELVSAQESAAEDSNPFAALPDIINTDLSSVKDPQDEEEEFAKHVVSNPIEFNSKPIEGFSTAIDDLIKFYVDHDIISEIRTLFNGYNVANRDIRGINHKNKKLQNKKLQNKKLLETIIINLAIVFNVEHLLEIENFSFSQIIARPNACDVKKLETIIREFIGTGNRDSIFQAVCLFAIINVVYVKRRKYDFLASLDELCAEIILAIAISESKEMLSAAVLPAADAPAYPVESAVVPSVAASFNSSGAGDFLDNKAERKAFPKIPDSSPYGSAAVEGFQSSVSPAVPSPQLQFSSNGLDNSPMSFTPSNLLTVTADLESKGYEISRFSLLNEQILSLPACHAHLGRYFAPVRILNLITKRNGVQTLGYLIMNLGTLKAWMSMNELYNLANSDRGYENLTQKLAEIQSGAQLDIQLMQQSLHPAAVFPSPVSLSQPGDLSCGNFSSDGDSKAEAESQPKRRKLGGPLPYAPSGQSSALFAFASSAESEPLRQSSPSSGGISGSSTFFTSIDEVARLKINLRNKRYPVDKFELSKEQLLFVDENHGKLIHHLYVRDILKILTEENGREKLEYVITNSEDLKKLDRYKELSKYKKTLPSALKFAKRGCGDIESELVKIRSSRGSKPDVQPIALV